MGVAAAIAAAAAWAVSATMMASQMTRVDSLSISALRLLWASLFFAALIVPIGAEADLVNMPAGDMAQLVGTGLLNLAVGDTLYIIAIAALGINRAYTISLALFTLFSFVLAVILLDEPVSWTTAWGSALIVGGVALVAVYGRGNGMRVADVAATAAAAPPGTDLSAPPADAPVIASGSESAPPAALARVRPFGLGSVRLGLRTGLLLITLAAILWAFGTVWLRSVSQDYEATAVGAIRIPTSAIVLTVAALLVQGSTVRRRSLSQWSMFMLALAGIVGGGVGSVLFIFAIQEIGAGKTAVLSSVSPLFALPLAALFLGERITPWVVGGTLLAVFGIVLLS